MQVHRHHGGHCHRARVRQIPRLANFHGNRHQPKNDRGLFDQPAIDENGSI